MVGMTARDIRLDVLGVSKSLWIADKEAESAATLTVGSGVQNRTRGADSDGDADTDPPTGLLERVDVLPSWRVNANDPRRTFSNAPTVPVCSPPASATSSATPATANRGSSSSPHGC